MFFVTFTVVVSKRMGRTVFLFWQNVTNVFVGFWRVFRFPQFVFLYFLPFIAAAAAVVVVVRPATCWSGVTIARVKTAATNTAKTVDETRVIACDGRYHACTWTTSRRRKPVSETGDAPVRLRWPPFAVARPRGTGSPISFVGNANRLSSQRTSTRAPHTTCSDCRHPSPVIITSDSQTVVIVPNPKPLLTGPISKIFDEHTSPSSSNHGSTIQRVASA